MCRDLPLRLTAAILALLPLAAASSHDVALLGDPPSDHRHGWVTQWLGTYVSMPLDVNGRPTYAKADDTGKVIWSLASGEWRIGRERDIKTGRGLFSVRESDALAPDLVVSTWQIATEGHGWTDAPGLACVPAPPPVVYLFGHAPSSNWPLRGWVSTWLGAYELQPELMNGRPVYGRDEFVFGRDDALVLSSQRLWFARSDASEPGFWFFGPASGLGGSLGWLSAMRDALAPHLVGSSWRTASEEAGHQVKRAVLGSATAHCPALLVLARQAPGCGKPSGRAAGSRDEPLRAAQGPMGGSGAAMTPGRSRRTRGFQPSGQCGVGTGARPARDCQPEPRCRLVPQQRHGRGRAWSRGIWLEAQAAAAAAAAGGLRGCRVRHGRRCAPLAAPRAGARQLLRRGRARSRGGGGRADAGFCS